MHVSSGDLIRGEIKKGTVVGKKMEEIVARGGFVNDSLALSIIEKKLASFVHPDIVLDGFPRTLEQAKMLDDSLGKSGKKIGLAILVESSDELIVKRLSARRICPKCNRIYGLDIPPQKDNLCDSCGSNLSTREDDKEDVVRQRLKTYNDLTFPIIIYYERRGVLRRVDGNGDLKGIFENVSNVLKENYAKLSTLKE